jgi:hypothetical protein
MFAVGHLQLHTAAGSRAPPLVVSQIINTLHTLCAQTGTVFEQVTGPGR